MSRRNKKKFSPQFERDFDFYLSHRNTFTFSGTDTKKDFGIQFPGEPEPIEKDDDGNEKPVPFAIPYSPTGKPAKVCFFTLDSEGKSKPCSEPELLVEILRCKGAVNLQIKLWSQGRAEYTLSKDELQEYMEFYNAPDWVFKAIENQKSKILKEWIEKKLYNSNYYLKIFELHLGEILSDEEFGSGVILDPK